MPDQTMRQEGAGFTEAQRKRLAAPLNKANVKKNPKGFDYIESYHAIGEANDIFGPEGWSQEVVTLQCVHERESAPNVKPKASYVCVAKVTVHVPGFPPVVRSDSGFGDQVGQDLGACHEGAAKEAVSDAVKRCLRTFGNPFGLALYEKPDANGNRSEVKTDAQWYAELNLTADQRGRVKAARAGTPVEVVIAELRKKGEYEDAEDFTAGVEAIYGKPSPLLADVAPTGNATTTGAYAR